MFFFRKLAVVGFVLALSVNARVAAQDTRKASFAGHVQSNDTTTLVVVTDLSGDLPGYFTFSLTRDAGTLSGSWLWVQKRENADGSIEDVGMLEGTIESARLTPSEKGTLAALANAQLRVVSGSGGFETVTSGTGTLDGTVDGAQFNGVLTLTL